MSENWKTIRVFISSTFKDMHAERDHLVRFVFPKLREELIKYHIHFVDVDLRWGVTSDEDATETCRQVIGECRPRFLCMLGGRYGYVPTGMNCSITADEIEFGVLNPPPHEHGPVRAFFYFRHEAATARMVEHESGIYREPAGSPAAEALAELKQSIADAGHAPRTYGENAQWDAAAKRLIGLEEFGNRVHDDLLQSLKNDPTLAARFAVSAAPRDEFAEESDAMESFIEERTDRYIVGSREPLLREMLAFAIADGTPNIFVLTGDSGSGKSAFLAKFTRELAVLHPSLFVLPTFIGASASSTDLRRTLRRLCHELALAAGNTEPLPLDIKDLITHFQKLLAEAANKQRVILVFDALDQFDATDGAHWLNWLPRELPPRVRIVASVIAPADGQTEHQTLAILRTRPGTRIEKLEPLTEADTLAVIEGSLRRYAKRLSPEQLAALLAKPAGRLPLYVLTALEELRTLGTYKEITARIRELPGDARALFGWILTERLARDPGFRDREGRPCGAALVGQFAACLGVSRHGLSPAELTALLDPGDPLGNVAALLRLLRPYLMRRGELLDFYHSQFREAAGAAHLETPEKQRAAHLSVATCLQAFADPHRDGLCRDATQHGLSELPHHLTRAEAWPDLIATLENILFLEAKVTHGMAFDLAGDIADAVRLVPGDHPQHGILSLLEEALRRDIHFIARHAKDYPQALFQCVWNSCWWYDSPEAAKHYDPPEGGWHAEGQPWLHPDPTLTALAESWRAARESQFPGFPWLRCLRPPLMHLGSAQLACLRGQDVVFSSVAFSSDGQRIASGSSDNTARVWDAQSGAELAVMHGHEGSVECVSYSPVGGRIASGAWDTTVRVWDAQSWAELAILRGHEGWVKSVSYSPDGLRIASGGLDNTVRVWDAQNGAELAVLRAHESMVFSVAWSPDGRRIVSGSADKTVRIWDTTTGTPLLCMRGHERAVISVAFSPDGQRIASASDDDTIRVWCKTIEAQLASLCIQEVGGGFIAFSPDGQRIASGSRDGRIRLWDSTCGAQLTYLHGHESRITGVAFSPDGRRIASSSNDGSVRLWNSTGGPQLARLRGHEEGIRSVAFSPDGQLIATGSWDKTARVWDSTSGVQLACLRGHESGVDVAFSPDGRRIATFSPDMPLRLWDSVSAECLEIDPSWFVGGSGAGSSHFPLRARTRGVSNRGQEDLIEDAATGQTVAWFPVGIENIVAHPSCRLWAGSVSYHLCIVRLEGDVEEKDRRSKNRKSESGDNS